MTPPPPPPALLFAHENAIGCAALAVFLTLTACTPTLQNRGTYYADMQHKAKNADSRIRFLVMPTRRSTRPARSRC